MGVPDRPPDSDHVRATVTRRRFLRHAGTVGLTVAGGGLRGLDPLAGRPSRLAARAGDTASAVRRFHSRPDLRPAGLSVAPVPRRSGYLFLGPQAHGGSQPGVLIATDR